MGSESTPDIVEIAQSGFGRERVILGQVELIPGELPKTETPLEVDKAYKMHVGNLEYRNGWETNRPEYDF